MKAVVLAAGYATRLRPLTDARAKELLPVGGRPILDWIVGAVREVPEVDEIHVVTNARKAPAFHEWVKGADADVHVHDDGTTSNEGRLGAIGDLDFVLRRTGLDDDLVVIAGDNLFDFSLQDYVSFWHSKGRASAVAVRDVGSLELATQYGVVALDGDGRLTDFVEKPADPPSTLAATATYVYHRAHVALVSAYLAEGHSPDQPGRLIGWLRAREPVYGWVFGDAWYDIGNVDQLLEADNHLRARHGLPLREQYAPTA
jgi:glucose-1-phosphate thymidylyltransferase